MVDEKGQVVPTATVAVTFEVSGAGELAAVGNASPTDVDSFQQPRRNTFRGRALAIVRPKGTAGRIILKASAKDLQAGEITIETHE